MEKKSSPRVPETDPGYRRYGAGMNSVVFDGDYFVHLYYDSSYYWPNHPGPSDKDKVLRVSYGLDPVLAIQSAPIRFNGIDQLGSVFSTNPSLAYINSGDFPPDDIFGPGTEQRWFFAIAENDHEIVIYATDGYYDALDLNTATWCKIGSVDHTDTGFYANANPGFARDEHGNLYLEYVGGNYYGYIAFGRGNGLDIAMGMIRFEVWDFLSTVKYADCG